MPTRVIHTYVESPRTVEAIRLVTRNDFDDAMQWMRDDGAQCSSVVLEGSLLPQSYIMIHRVEGAMPVHVNYGQWILRRDVGVFEVMDADLFDHVYVSAEAIG